MHHAPALRALGDPTRLPSGDADLKMDLPRRTLSASLAGGTRVSQDPPPTAPIPPRRREYQGRVGLKTVDAQERMNLALPGIIGLIFGGLVAYRLGLPVWIGAVVGAAFVILTVRFVLRGVARLVIGSIFGAGSTSTPRRREYSLAESLLARGDDRGAIEAFERHVTDDPGDPEPYLRIARLYRDRLEQPEPAAAWLDRCRRASRIDPGLELVVTQELIELYLNKLQQPRKAIPELNLICHKFPGTPNAAAAERELVELRAMLAVEQMGDLSLTQQYLDNRSKRGTPPPS